MLETTVRRAFALRLRPGCAKAYRQRHDRLWPELMMAFRVAGVLDYAIFLDGDDRTLVGVQVLRADHGLDALRGSELMRRWWEHMADLMDPDHPPSRPLTEVFDLARHR